MELTSNDRQLTANFPKFNENQSKFVFCRYNFVMGSGGYGSGKTTALCCRAILLSTDNSWFGNCAGAEGVLGRYKHLDFTKTTLPELLRLLPNAFIKKVYKKEGMILLVNIYLLITLYVNSVGCGDIFLHFLFSSGS